MGSAAQTVPPRAHWGQCGLPACGRAALWLRCSSAAQGPRASDHREVTQCCSKAAKEGAITERGGGRMQRWGKAECPQGPAAPQASPHPPHPVVLHPHPLGGHHLKQAHPPGDRTVGTDGRSFLCTPPSRAHPEGVRPFSQRQGDPSPGMSWLRQAVLPCGLEVGILPSRLSSQITGQKRQGVGGSSGHPLEVGRATKHQ